MHLAGSAEQYARDVVSGRIPACKWTKLACSRFLRDIEDPRWEYRRGRVQEICEFIELLHHSEGEWAERGETIKLEPWQCFIIAGIFGFIDKKTGYRRIRRVYLEIPRKNGKSLLGAAIGAVMLLIDGEAGPLVLTGATKLRQAKKVFTPARQFMLRDPDLRDAFDVTVNAQSLVLPDGGMFEPVVGRPGDGDSVSCAIIDEYHEHKTDELREAMVTGTKARRQPLTLIITTAGFSLTSPCAQMNADMRQVLEGLVEDEQTFTCIWTIDEDDDWTTEDALRKANPNYGISVSAEQLTADLREAITRPAKQGAYKTKHLNVWVRAGSPFFDVEAWKRGARDIRLEDFRGKRCILGGDLASRRDLAALVMMFEVGEGEFAVIPRFYLNEDQARAEQKIPYEQWAKDGWIFLTPGNVTDHDVIEADILDLHEEYGFLEFTLDPTDASQLITHTMNAGIEVVSFPQSTTKFYEPMIQLDADIVAGKIIHDGNPVMTWNIANTIGKRFGIKKVRPARERDESKIDGAVAAIMARGRWMDQELDEAPDYFYAA